MKPNRSFKLLAILAVVTLLMVSSASAFSFADIKAFFFGEQVTTLYRSPSGYQAPSVTGAFLSNRDYDHYSSREYREYGPFDPVRGYDSTTRQQVNKPNPTSFDEAIERCMELDNDQEQACQRNLRDSDRRQCISDGMEYYNRCLNKIKPYAPILTGAPEPWAEADTFAEVNCAEVAQVKKETECLQASDQSICREKADREQKVCETQQAFKNALDSCNDYESGACPDVNQAMTDLCTQTYNEQAEQCNRDRGYAQQASYQFSVCTANANFLKTYCIDTLGKTKTDIVQSKGLKEVFAQQAKFASGDTALDKKVSDLDARVKDLEAKMNQLLGGGSTTTVQRGFGSSRLRFRR